MSKTTLKWIIGPLLVAAVLAATYYVVDINQSAMSGSKNEKPSTFYEH